MTTAPPHVWLDAENRAWLDDTNVKVIEVALDHVAYGWSAEEIHNQHPHLSLPQIYAALAYYYDHQVKLDKEMEQSRSQAEKLVAQTGDSPLRRRLRALGKL
jgi:uncharacterized protein (DUF433 family)